MLDYLKSLAEVGREVYQLNGADRYQLNYTSVADFVLDRGSPPKVSEPLTEEQYEYLLQVAEDCIEEHFEYKQCFYNSQVLLLSDFQDRMVYWEGFCFTGVMPAHHGWLELDGKLVDVTYTPLKRPLDAVPPKDLKDRVLGKIPEGWEYLGVPFDKEDVRDFIFEHCVSDGLIGNFRQIEKTFMLPRKK